MQLSEPAISFSFPAALEYSVYSKPQDFYCIDGFPKEAQDCVIVVPAPMRGGHTYQSLKPAVLIIPQSPSPVTSPKLSSSLHLSEHFSPRQVLALYAKYKQKIKEREKLTTTRNSHEVKDATTPMRAWRPETSLRHLPAHCALCRPTLPCARCSKQALLALTKRVPLKRAESRAHPPLDTGAKEGILPSGVICKNSYYYPLGASRSSTSSASSLILGTFECSNTSSGSSPPAEFSVCKNSSRLSSVISAGSPSNCL